MLKLPSRKEVIEKFKNNGGKIAAVAPYHYPKALFRAFNILPIELWGPPKQNTLESKSHIQTYVCSVAHSILAFYKKGMLKDCDFILIPHTCDSLQGLGSIFLDFLNPSQKVLTFYLPRGRRNVDLCFLRKEIKKIYKLLCEFTGQKPDYEEIINWIKTEEKAVSLQKKLIKNRLFLNIDDYSLYKIIRSKEYLPAEEFVKIAEKTLSAKKTNEKSARIPIIMSGLVPEPLEIMKIINEKNGIVTGDDFAAIGRRFYPQSEGNDPFIRIAKSLLNSPPDSSRGDSVKFRLNHLLNLASKTNAKGVVFYIITFCEMEYFYLPHLKKGLREKGIKSIVIDTDINQSLSQQAITRLEVFMETLQ